MVGLQIVIKDADFSGNNNGKAGLSNVYFENGGITNGTQKAAYTTFINKFVSLGLAEKFDYARLFFNIGQSDRLNIVNPQIGVSAYTGSFILDDPTRHTIEGWKGSLGGAYLQSNYVFPPGNLSNLHFHAFATEAETNDNSALFALLLQPGTYPGNDIWMQLSKASTGAIKTICEKQSTGDSFLTAIGATTGLVSLVASGGKTKIYDNGVKLNEEVQTSIPFVNGVQPELNELWGGGSVAITLTQSRNFFTGMGTKGWTDQNEADLNEILIEFRAAI